MRRRAVIGLICTAVAGCGGSSTATTTHRAAVPAAPAGKVVSIPVHGNPEAIGAGFGSIWAIGHRNGFIYRIDPRTARVTKTIGLGGTFYLGFALGDGAIWTYRDDTHRLLKVDPAGGRVLASRSMPLTLYSMTIGPGGLWSLAGGNSLLQLDPKTLRVSRRIRLPIRSTPGGGFYLTQGLGSLWVAGRDEIARLDPLSGRVVKRFRISGPANAIAVGHGAVYYTDSNKEDLYRVALPGGHVTALGRVTSQPGELALLGGRAFVTDDGSNSLTAVDPATGQRGKTLVLRRGPAVGNNEPDGIGLDGIAQAGGALWLPDWDANEIYRVPLGKLA